MSQYHKIQTVYKRDPANYHKTLLDGEFSLPEFAYLAACPWVWTEKVDGTNIRVMWDGTNITLGGKTDNVQLHADLVKHLQETFTQEVMLEVFGAESDVCLYGEGCGAGIQKGGGNYYPDKRFVLFDVRIGEWWLQRKDIEGVAASLDIPIVPIIGCGSLPAMVDMVRTGFPSAWGDFQAEGIVARPMVELQTRAGNRIITKLKAKDFRKGDK